MNPGTEAWGFGRGSWGDSCDIGWAAYKALEQQNLGGGRRLGVREVDSESAKKKERRRGTLTARDRTVRDRGKETRWLALGLLGEGQKSWMG